MITLSDKSFNKAMNNIVEYSMGFLDGVKYGKRVFLSNLGKDTIEVIKDYIDTNARVNPELMHHVYEWSLTGSPSGRLFDIDYTVSNLGLSFKSTFKQSQSIKSGSNVPFYDKARIMEQGVPVTIRPKRAEALAFTVDGENVFSRGPIQVLNPGGNTQGQYEKVFDSFFTKYFTQAFLKASGIMDRLQDPKAYKDNIRSGVAGGRSKGVDVGYRWIANVKVGI